MSRIPLKFKYPIATLVTEGGYILDAAESHADVINPRLEEGFVAHIRTLLTEFDAKIFGQKSAVGDLGDLTQEQNHSLKLLKEKMGRARESAKLAFPGQDSKLRNEFQVGAKPASKLATLLQQANIIKTACAVPANAAELARKGWIAADTTALGANISELDDVDSEQEDAKPKAIEMTDARNADANDLHDAFVAIQNAANNQFPEMEATNGPVRLQFRIGIFPPKQKKKKKDDSAKKSTPPSN